MGINVDDKGEIMLSLPLSVQKSTSTIDLSATVGRRNLIPPIEALEKGIVALLI